MISLDYRHTLIIGFVLVLLGMVIPWLIILKILESTFFLNFLAYGMSVAGLFLGLVGAASYVRGHKKKDDNRH